MLKQITEKLTDKKVKAEHQKWHFSVFKNKYDNDSFLFHLQINKCMKLHNFAHLTAFIFLTVKVFQKRGS